MIVWEFRQDLAYTLSEPKAQYPKHTLVARRHMRAFDLMRLAFARNITRSRESVTVGKISVLKG